MPLLRRHLKRVARVVGIVLAAGSKRLAAKPRRLAPPDNVVAFASAPRATAVEPGRAGAVILPFRPRPSTAVRAVAVPPARTGS